MITLQLGSKITPRQERVRLMLPTSSPNENHQGGMLNTCSSHTMCILRGLEGPSSGSLGKPGVNSQLLQLPHVSN